jgi:hypothetical protein
MPYGVSGEPAVSSRCGLSGAAPEIAPDAAMKARVCRLCSRTASSSVASDCNPAAG